MFDFWMSDYDKSVSIDMTVYDFDDIEVVGNILDDGTKIKPLSSEHIFDNTDFTIFGI